MQGQICGSQQEKTEQFDVLSPTKECCIDLQGNGKWNAGYYYSPAELDNYSKYCSFCEYAIWLHDENNILLKMK